MPSERSQIEKMTYYTILLRWYSWKKKTIRTENRSVIARETGMWGGTDYKGSARENFLRNEIVWIFIVLIVKQIYAFAIAKTVNFT